MRGVCLRPRGAGGVGRRQQRAALVTEYVTAGRRGAAVHCISSMMSHPYHIITAGVATRDKSGLCMKDQDLVAVPTVHRRY
jgi:hypothetical protein